MSLGESLRQLYRTGDLWGGFAAMLVALPASIAFGVTIHAAISPEHAALGALAGIIGAAVLGSLAALLGGTDRLISAPCAPAAALLSAFAIELAQAGVPGGNIVLLLLVLGVLAGLFQIAFGFVGIGRLIKYIPYPVVSGYLTAVGLIIIGSQLGKLLGATQTSAWLALLTHPANWDPRAIAIGATTMLTMWLGPRLTQRLPATILGIAAGMLCYFALAIQDERLFEVSANPLIIGLLGASGEGYVHDITARWHEIGDLKLNQLAALLGNALTLAVLLSIDTLKTCVVLDQMTRSRHNPNRELVAQGVANLASAAVGGIPGAGTMGATLVNLSSGATTRASGVIEGLACLVFALLLGNFIAWLPVAALAGILIVVGLRMIDRGPLRFIQSSATVLDFGVVAIVVVVALGVGLIAASGVGVALSILLFLREQIGGSVIRHKFFANQMSSRWHRPESETRILAQKGDQAVIFELQGSLFFGTTQQLYSELEPELARRRYIILDFRRVQSLDVTAAHLLSLVRDSLAEHQGQLLLSDVRENLPNGRNLREFLEQTGVTGPDQPVRLFPELDSALEWVEDRLLGETENMQEDDLPPLELIEMEVFKQRKDETLADLESRLVKCAYRAGETIYSRGEPGNAIYLIRKGSVNIIAPLGGGRSRHVATFGRGDFFGGLAFLDGLPRGNDAVAATDSEFFVLSQEQFERLSEEHKKLALTLLRALARSLALRLRHADQENAMRQEY